MYLLISILVGILFAAGIYMILRRSVVKLIIGLVLLSHAANLLIFTAGRMNMTQPPIVKEGATFLSKPYADPLPQALILTAIVISFGLTAFAIVLIKKTYLINKTEDLNELNTTDKIDKLE